MSDSRLYRQFRPKHYALRIRMDRAARGFSGSVAIRGESVEDGAIVLHAHRLRIVRADIDGQRATFEHGEQDTLSLHASSLKAGEHEIALEFEGRITNPMHGLYPCYFTVDGQAEELLMTQFESHHAREVFPCVDEPEAKATFELTLESETGITVVSNTPIKKQREQDGKLVTAFRTTPVMSTYLLAWVAGKLDRKEATTKDGVTVGAYAVKGKGDQLDYALDVAVKELECMNDYFGVPYPLAKCDLIAVPDFSAGAMENWGCMTFRESIMLVDEHSSTRTKQFAAMVIAHELAHQWFGDLVTMRWWNDLWLNESFANWMEYYVPDKLHPEWQLMTQYYDDETTRAIERDGLASVQKIQQDVHTPQEIQALFDPAIVYAKGGSLINMLHAHLGDAPFREGLRLYFKRHKYGSTEAADLWKAWGDVSRRDITSFMTPWITQAGLPVVSVEVNDNTATLRQRRFFSSTRPGNGGDHTLWPIPLLSAGQLSENVLTQASASLRLQPTSQPLLLNRGRTGYYLTRYSPAHLQKLADEVHGGTLDVIDRMGLLSDSFNLSKAGLQPFMMSLRLLDAYRDERSMPVWGSIKSHMAALKVFADDDEDLLKRWRTYTRDFARRQYERLGWTPTTGEPYFDELLRPQIIALLADAEDTDVVAELRHMFDEAVSPTDVWADIRQTVFASAARFGDEIVFDKLRAWHKSTTSAEQRTQLAFGLSATRDPKLIRRALDMLTTDDVKLQDLFYWVIGLTRNHFARDMVWQWTQGNWQWVVDNFGNDLHYADFPKYMADAFSKPGQLSEYKAFFGPMLGTPGIGRAVAQGIEDIEGRVQWIERDGQEIVTFLRGYTSSSQVVIL